MSVRAVARKDFLDARRARIVWLVGGSYAALLALFFAQVRLGALAVAGPRTPDVLVALWHMAFVGAVFVPAVALVAAYLAIAGERESGRIKRLLSTPISRRDVVLGKFASRAAIVGLSLLVAFGAAAALASVWFGSLRPAVFVGIAALTTLYALAYVSVAIAISATTASRSRAMLAALAFYFGTNSMTMNEDVSGLAGLEYVLNGLFGLGVGEAPIQFVGILTNPTRAYLLAAAGAFPDALTGTMDLPVPADLAWYVRPEVGVVVLLAWAVVPILVGSYRFDRADIS